MTHLRHVYHPFSGGAWSGTLCTETLNARSLGLGLHSDPHFSFERIFGLAFVDRLKRKKEGEEKRSIRGQNYIDIYPSLPSFQSYIIDNKKFLGIIWFKSFPSG